MKEGFIDFHIHFDKPFHDPELTEDNLLLWMDENGIDKAVLLALESPESSIYRLTSRQTLAASKRHPDRFIPFVTIDPRALMYGMELFRKVLEQYRDEGAVGFGEHKCGLKIDDPQNQEVYAICQEFAWPILVHADGLNGDERGFPRLEKLLNDFPKLDFIMHAGHWWQEISLNDSLVGYPKGPVNPGGAVDRLLSNYPNIWGDLSAFSGYNAITRDPEFGREFLIRQQDKLLFGTDFIWPGQPTPIIQHICEVDIPEIAREKIAYGNAKKLLKL